MKLELIYNDLLDIIKNEMDFSKALKLKEKLENAIRLETCYKTSSKTRVNAIKRIASKSKAKPSLNGYGICNDYKCITDTFHAVMIFEENIPLKLATTNKELVDKIGHENCINIDYPDFKNVINFNKDLYHTIKMDFDDMEHFYKLHKKNAESELYIIDDKFYNIKYVKNIIDVLGTDITIYSSNDVFRPLYFVNNKNEIGLVLSVRKY